MIKKDLVKRVERLEFYNRKLIVYLSDLVYRFNSLAIAMKADLTKLDRLNLKNEIEQIQYNISEIKRQTVLENLK